MTRARIFVISGGNGSSGEQLGRTAAAQFPDHEFEVSVVPGVRRIDEIEAAFDRHVTTSDSIVIHSLVDTGLRCDLVALAEERGIAVHDALGPLLDGLATLLDTTPAGQPGLYRKLHEDYFRRIEAIEFAVQHDDGRRFHELDEADIVLAGVSRAGKTPLSMYLGMLGYKTANVPLVKDIPPPEELFEIPRSRVVGLDLDPERLATYRRKRSHRLGAGSMSTYTDPKEIHRDLEHARQIFRRGRFATIDVTNKPIEESASEVITVVMR